MLSGLRRMCLQDPQEITIEQEGGDCEALSGASNLLSARHLLPCNTDLSTTVIIILHGHCRAFTFTFLQTKDLVTWYHHGNFLSKMKFPFQDFRVTCMSFHLKLLRTFTDGFWHSLIFKTHFNVFIFILFPLKGSHTKWKRWRALFHSLLHSLYVQNSCKWDMWKPGGKSFVWLFHNMHVDLSTWDINH